MYVFDEASSFLDVRQRLAVTEVIRSLVTPELWAMSESGGVATKKCVLSLPLRPLRFIAARNSYATNHAWP